MVTWIVVFGFGFWLSYCFVECLMVLLLDLLCFLAGIALVFWVVCGVVGFVGCFVVIL